MRLLCTLGVLLASGTAALAGNPPGYRQTYRYDYATQKYQTVYIAESVLVPVVVPSALMINLAPPVSPPPVTVAPQALSDAHGQNAAMIQRMAALEQKLDLLLNGGQVPGRMPLAAAPVPARPSLQQVAGVLKASCAQCHTGQNGRGEVRLFDDSGSFNPNIPPSVILAAVRQDRMPKNPDKLSPENKNLLELWIRPEGVSQ